VILLTAVLAGLLVGLLRARWAEKTWQFPQLRHSWLVLIAFLPQLFAFYLPVSRDYISVSLAAVCLVGSQVGLLLFCLLNRQQTWILILAAGLFLNLLVITANGGFMPLSTQTAAQLIPEHILQNIKIGSRLGASSKDILLPLDAMAFPWLSDRFLPPAWFPYQFAFSIGDIFIGLGAFFLLSVQSGSLKNREKGSFRYANGPSGDPARDSSENTLRLR
jgi:hypothetical protein